MTDRTRINEMAIAISRNINDILEGMGATVGVTGCMASPYRYTDYLSKNPCTRMVVRIRGLHRYSKEFSEQLKKTVSERFCESLECRESKAIRFMDFYLE